MNLKFLPLGSVCQVDNADLKLVVIGYKINGYDYVAVDYPTGYENANSLRYFNHEQIKELYSYGYKDEFGKNHFISLNDGTPNAVNSELEENGFKFDDMGIVIEDDNAVEVPVVEESINPGFYFDENGVVVVDATAPEVVEAIPTSPVENNFKFDENGVVVSDATAPETPVENNFEFDENGVVVADATAPETPVENNFEFDENGVVVADATAPETPIENNFEFDENGVVVADATAPLTSVENKFSFDENGVVVADATAPEVQVEEKFKFDENGVVVADATAPLIPSVNNFQFDENGMVISDNTVSEGGIATSSNDEQSIFGDIEAPGVIDEPQAEFDVEEKVIDEVSNLDIPTPDVPIVSEEVPTALESSVEEKPIPEKKEEKKKKGFFSFGK